MIQPICRNCRFAEWQRHESGRINVKAPGKCTHHIFEHVAALNASVLPVCCFEKYGLRPPIVFSAMWNASGIARNNDRPCDAFEPMPKVKK